MVLNLVLNVMLLPALVIDGFIFFAGIALIRLLTPAEHKRSKKTKHPWKKAISNRKIAHIV